MQIVNPTPAAMYSGITNAVAQISSTEGVRSLWRGIASVALGAGTYTSFACRVWVMSTVRV